MHVDDLLGISSASLSYCTSLGCDSPMRRRSPVTPARCASVYRDPNAFISVSSSAVFNGRISNFDDLEDPEEAEDGLLSRPTVPSAFESDASETRENSLCGLPFRRSVRAILRRSGHTCGSDAEMLPPTSPEFSSDASRRYSIDTPATALLSDGRRQSSGWCGPTWSLTGLGLGAPLQHSSDDTVADADISYAEAATPNAPRSQNINTSNSFLSSVPSRRNRSSTSTSHVSFNRPEMMEGSSSTPTVKMASPAVATGEEARTMSDPADASGLYQEQHHNPHPPATRK